MRPFFQRPLRHRPRGRRSDRFGHRREARGGVAGRKCRLECLYVFPSFTLALRIPPLRSSAT